MEPRIVLVAVTGGPCSGKTSWLSATKREQSRLAALGYALYGAAETATLLIEQGMRLKQAIREKRWADVREYQREIIGFQIENENRLARCAMREDRPAVILCDRGVLDSRAYLERGREGDTIFRELLREFGRTPIGERERYAGVIKLTTAADGAEEFYTMENNAARDEDPETARHLDRRIEEAWTGRPNLFVIDNSTDFPTKKLRATQALHHILGIPEPLEIEKKYRIPHPCLQHFPVYYSKVYMEQTYLRPEKSGEQLRIRCRTQDGDSTYYFTKKTRINSSTSIETEEPISWRNYFRLLENRDPTRGTIRKDRICFIWKNQYFELDIFRNIGEALCILEVELTNLQSQVSLPDFLGVSEKDDVTADPKYKNENLAKGAKD